VSRPPTGAAAAPVAPVAVRLGDRGRTRGATGAALVLAAAAVGLDLAVQTTLVLGQRAV